eukprot:7609201-Lingulodinium_polyedra.AAC.1
MPRHATPCHAIPRHAMPRTPWPCRAASRHATPRRAMACHSTLGVPDHAMECIGHANTRAHAIAHVNPHSIQCN